MGTMLFIATGLAAGLTAGTPRLTNDLHIIIACFHPCDSTHAPLPAAHLTARLDTLGTMRVALPPAGSSMARKMLASPAQR